MTFFCFWPIICFPFSRELVSYIQRKDQQGGKALSKIVPAAGVLVNCIDPRFMGAALKATRHLAGNHIVVPRSRPGATLRHCRNCAVTQELIQDIAEISIPHHGMFNLFIAHHADCLAYGGSKSFSSMEEERDAHVVDMRAGRKLFGDEVLAHAEILLKYGDITSKERAYLERALNGDFKVTTLFLSPPPGRRSFTDDEVRIDILQD